MARILIADDSRMVRHFYEGVLSSLGQELELCETGNLALEAFNRSPAELVILDFDMPGMNGCDCCKAIRSSPEGVMVPIVMVSSHDDEARIGQCLDAGANDYLVKPVKETHLLAKLKSFLKASAFRKTECDLIKAHAEIAGRYRVERMLGSGSHATVFLASDLREGGRKVALKMLKESASREEIAKPLFEIAGKIAGVSSSRVVKILDMGQSNGRLFIVMEYVGGGDLSGLMKKRGVLDERSAAKMASDVAFALESFHSAGLLHMDVKPENILCSPDDDRFKLADFGLVSMRSSGTMPLNAEIWSTLAYVPPEYFSEAAEVGPKSDIYSLGVTLYQCMTGDNPFVSERPAITMFRQINFQPPPLKQCCAAVSPKMSSLIEAMLSKRMDARPSASESARLLDCMVKLSAPSKPR